MSLGIHENGKGFVVRVTFPESVVKYSRQKYFSESGLVELEFAKTFALQQTATVMVDALVAMFPLAGIESVAVTERVVIEIDRE